MNPTTAWPRSLQVALVLFIILSTGFILKTAQAVLVPTALAVLMAFLLHPLVKRVQKWGLNRVLAVLLVVGVASVMVGVVGYVVFSQVKSLADDLPNHRHTIEEKVLTLKRYTRGGTLERVQEMFARIDEQTEQRVEQEAARQNAGTPVDDSQPPPVETESDAELAAAEKVAREVEEAAADSIGPVEWFTESSILGTTMGILGTAGLVIVLLVFFLVQQVDIRDRIVGVAGRGALATTTKALEEAGARISRYLLMQFIINATYGMAVMIGLLLIQVPYAAMWGLCAALFRYIPYVGPWIGALLPIGMSLIAPGWTQPWLVIGLFLVLELISNNIMEPVLYGHSVGLSEVAVILAAMAWAWIWGPVGLVLATPLTVCLVVLGKYVPGLRLFDQLLGERPPVGEPIRLYQRLLAKDDEEAEEFVETFLEEHSVLETYDQLLLPTLGLMHQDLAHGQIDEDDAAWIRTTMDSVLSELPGWAAKLSQAVTKERAAANAAKEGQEEQTEAAPRGDVPAPVVVGMTSRSDDEELVLQMIQDVLVDAPCRFEILSNRLLMSERIAKLVEFHPVAVCISSMPPGDLAHTRQICKRLRQQLPNTKLVVGRWAAHTKAERNEQLKAAGSDSVVDSLTEMDRLLRLSVQQARAKVNSDSAA